MGRDRVAVDVYLEESDTLEIMAEEVRRGLTRTPKHLPPKYFYDERGSWLFERITELPEYYLTRAERELLDRHVADIARRTRPAELVELGPGSASKTDALLEACREEGPLRRYLPVEVSEAMVEHSAERLAVKYPWLEIHAIVGDFERHLDRIPEGEDRLVAFLGSTLGNFVRDDAVRFLSDAADLLASDGTMLLGTDLVKDRRVLEAAYNDSQGVTAEFNRNVLRVINNRLGGQFDPEAYEHVAWFNEGESRMEMHLESVADQTVAVRDLELIVDFDEGERMRTEVSCKYTRESLESILHDAGLALREWFTDDDERFALALATVREP